jgi:hypothetical protein
VSENPLSASCLSCIVLDKVWELLDFWCHGIELLVAPAEIVCYYLFGSSTDVPPYLLLAAVVRIRCVVALGEWVRTV